MQLVCCSSGAGGVNISIDICRRPAASVLGYIWYVRPTGDTGVNCGPTVYTPFFKKKQETPSSWWWLCLFSTDFQFLFSLLDSPVHLQHIICVATLPCGTLMSEKERLLQANVLINDQLHGTVVTYLGGVVGLSITELRKVYCWVRHWNDF